MRYYVIGTNGIGFWPNSCDVFQATRYNKFEDAMKAFESAALTDWGRKESNIVAVDMTMTTLAQFGELKAS